jgi:hypothetical protein
LTSDLTVACVLRASKVYTPEWVARLQRGVARHLSLPHRFVCLSDVDVPCERIPLETEWPGWWSKIELFRPGLFNGPVLYFDLDTVVVGSLDAMAAYPHKFTAAHEFYRPQQLCSTAMAWRGDFGIWQAFADNPTFHMKHWDSRVTWAKTRRIGDQAFIDAHLRATGVGVAFFRDVCGARSVASFKVDDCSLRPPADAAVVAFHGKPKPNEIIGGWVRDQWA